MRWEIYIPTARRCYSLTSVSAVRRCCVPVRRLGRNNYPLLSSKIAIVSPHDARPIPILSANRLPVLLDNARLARFNSISVMSPLGCERCHRLE